MMTGLRFGTLCFLTAIMAGSAQDAPKAVKGGGPSTPAAAPKPARLVRLDVAIYSLTVDALTGLRIDADALRQAAESRESLEKAIGSLGEVTQVGLIDRSVNIMDSIKITLGASVPIPQSSSPSKNGTLQTTVTYQDCGVILEMMNVRELDADAFTANLELEVSSLGQSRIQIAKDVNAPVFQNYKENTSIRFAFGKPMVNVMLANPDGGDEVTAIIVRYSFSKADQ